MNPSESRIQQDCLRWYQNTYCLAHHKPRCMILHIPNEGMPQLTAIGLYKGAADLLVIHMGATHFVEVKTPTGVQSPAQKKFQAHCIDCGIPYHLVRSVEDFIAIFTTQ